MPSVMFTAFEVPLTMSSAQTNQSQVPRSRSSRRVNERWVDVSTQ